MKSLRPDPRSAALLLAALLLAGVGRAADAPVSRCPAPEARQFDFWIGTWEVRDMGAPSGQDRIEAILDGCVLQEHWRGVSGSAGTSLSFYDTGRRRWRQLWVWREGTTLELEGGFQEGAMVLEGPGRDPDGAPVVNRIAWSPQPDGSLRQHWQISRDGGARWRTEFDGVYRRLGD